MADSTEFMKLVHLAIARLSGVRLFRNNTGTGWQGSRVEAGRFGSKIIHDARPLRAGLHVGSSDLIGWQSIEITPDMVGRRVAVFAAVEVKQGGGRLNEDQRTFLRAVKDAGGIAILARDPDVAAAEVEGYELPEA